MKSLSWNQIERTIGGLKFAVISISTFSLAMIVGTFLESTYGTEFANRFLYKSFFFMFLQFVLFLSIAMAALLRLPPKKRLYGFYTIHTGLILMGGGAFITFYSGIDGTITLLPGTPSRDIVLQKDVFSIIHPDKAERISYTLPFNALETQLNDQYGEVKLLRYFPFSEKKEQWITPEHIYNKDIFSSAKYRIANDNVSQEFILSLHPEADFKSGQAMGPLNVHYLPSSMASCFVKNSPSQLFFWNKGRKCFTPEERSLKIHHTNSKKRFVVIKTKEKVLSFFPEVSPWPLDEKKRPLTQSPIKVFSTRLFEGKPHLFLFGHQLVFHQEGKWILHSLKENKEVELPWMGFNLKLLHFDDKKIPVSRPVYYYPKQIEGKVVEGEGKAVEIEIAGKKYWVTDERVLSLSIKGKTTHLYLKKKELRLPFEFTLTKFKMDKNPGTTDPASYESFVRLFTKDGFNDHHVFMNNPLKHEGFTFYQSSYFETENGDYGSVLSANVDPGRAIKYAGAILLILGAFWHYRIRRYVS